MKRPRDTNQLGKLVVDIATGQIDDEPQEESKKAQGGHARAKALSPERRKEIARKAAAARWA